MLLGTIICVNIYDICTIFTIYPDQLIFKTQWTLAISDRNLRPTSKLKSSISSEICINTFRTTAGSSASVVFSFMAPVVNQYSVVVVYELCVEITCTENQHVACNGYVRQPTYITQCRGLQNAGLEIISRLRSK